MGKQTLGSSDASVFALTESVFSVMRLDYWLHNFFVGFTVEKQ